MDEFKNTIKAVNKIQHTLAKLKKQRYMELLNRTAAVVGQFRDLGSESKKLGLSLTHNWFLASQRCCGRIDRLLYDISYSISRLQQLAGQREKNIPKLSTLVEEINQLQQEFERVDCDIAENTISVETQPITLEDLYLGPFRIELHLNKLCELYRDSPYYCIARDPHPAATSEDVTHPHVSNEKLCEGEGSVAVRTALEEGRICDFFTIVASILNTYSPDSPYISLDDWDGEPCYDCGYVMDRENCYYCSFCDRVFCEECSTYCRSCDETICLGCAGKCKICEEPVCQNCVRTCAECGISCCESCLEEDLCTNCKEELENEKNEEQEYENIGTPQLQNQKTSETRNPQIKLGS